MDLVSSLLYGFGGGVLDAHSGDAMSFHDFNCKAMSFVIEKVADARNTLEAGHDEPADRFETAISRQDEVVLTFEVQKIIGTFENKRRFGAQGRLLWRSNIELVFEFADKLFENILDGDYTGGGSELVDDYGLPWPN